MSETITILSNEQKQSLISQIKAYPLRVVLDGVDFGPLATAPTVTPQTTYYDETLYEASNNIVAKYVQDNYLEISFETKKINEAIEMKKAVVIGSNVYDVAAKKTLQLIPITSDSTAKVISFPNVYLVNSLNPTFKEGKEANTETMVVHALCDDSGLPFVFE